MPKHLFTLMLAAVVAATASGASSAEPAAATDRGAADTRKPRPYVDFEPRAVFPTDVVLTGIATDNRKVAKVRISIRNKRTGLWLQADGTWDVERRSRAAVMSDPGNPFATWTHRVTLPPGKYRIDVRARDHAGNVRRMKPRRTFFVDDQAPTSALLVAAGDVSRCSSDRDESTARLIDDLLADRSGVVGVLGDAAYPDGTAEQFAQCYDPSWGRHRQHTRPSVGNHEYRTPNAAAYFDYFGPAAGPEQDGWYAYDLGHWRIIVLNGNCGEIGGCESTSRQAAWLAAELANHPSVCTLAMTHQPRFSSGTHGDHPSIDALWDQLVGAGVEMLLSGHDHHYERLAPMNGSGNRTLSGTVQFVVGTGGTSLRQVSSARPNSRVLFDDVHGVLALELDAGAATFEFRPASGAAPLDAGTIACD